MGATTFKVLGEHIRLANLAVMSKRVGLLATRFLTVASLLRLGTILDAFCITVKDSTALFIRPSPEKMTQNLGVQDLRLYWSLNFSRKQS
jgi:hypothetical protein